jgi:sensor histidine kinase YesM
MLRTHEETGDEGAPGAWLPGLFAAWAGAVALGAVQSALAVQAMTGRVSWRWIVPPRLLDLVLGALFLPVLLWLVRRPPARGGWVAHVGALLAAAVAFTAVRSVAGVYLEQWLMPGLVFRGSRIAKAMGEFFAYAFLAGAVYALQLRRRLAGRERQALQLEARLSEARLEALASQLRPHFLFNTLNAISVLMHRDPHAADLMLTRLADLLRATLRTPAEREVPLRAEMELLGRYLDIMRVRFGARLEVRECVPPELAEARVPPFVLQPLVENALEHGIERRAGAGRVEVSARAEGGRLRLVVADDGAGVRGEGREGVGLSNTRRRLEQMYGSACRLALEPGDGGGTRAVVEIPLRTPA